MLPSNIDKLAIEGQLPVQLCNYVDVYKNEIITHNITFMKATASLQQIERLGLKKGDVVITKDSESRWDIAVPSLICEDIGGLVCGYHLARLEPIKIIGCYLAWCLRCYHIKLYFSLYASGITRYGLSTRALSDGRIPVPSLHEQQAIAGYLDTETARIDELIREKEDLIDLLNEAKSSLLSELITGDLLPGKLSGNDWIPHLPTGWQLKKLKHLGQIRSGLAKGKNIEDKQTLELPYLRVANVQDGYLDFSEVLTIPVEIDAVERYSLKPGDVLMNEGGDYDKLGRGAVWNGEINPCLHQNHVFAIRPYYADCSKWLAAITQTRYAKFYFMNNAKQSTNLASISQSNLKELPVLWPPAAERKRILKALKEAKGELDELITHTRDEIKLLRELRAATIADAVLGRIDVRDAGRDAAAVSQSAPPGLPSVAS